MTTAIFKIEAYDDEKAKRRAKAKITKKGVVV